MGLNRLLPMTIPELLRELCDVISNVQTLHLDVAFAKQQEIDAEMQAWVNSSETSIEGKKRAARYSAAVVTKEVIDLEAKLTVTIEEKYFILRLIEVKTGRLDNAWQ